MSLLDLLDLPVYWLAAALIGWAAVRWSLFMLRERRDHHE